MPENSKTYAFIDDSGDPGFSNKPGVSSHFVIAMVVFDDTLEIEKIAVAIKDYKRQIGLSEETEFKFNKSPSKVRAGFFEVIRGFDFRMYAIVVDKSLVHSELLKDDRSSFYRFFIKELLRRKSVLFPDLKVTIDGRGGKDFIKSFTSYLKNHAQKDGNKMEVKFKDSSGNVLIQLADMIAGAIRVSFLPKQRDSQIIHKIAKEKKDIWDFR